MALRARCSSRTGILCRGTPWLGIQRNFANAELLEEFLCSWGKHSSAIADWEVVLLSQRPVLPRKRQLQMPRYLIFADSAAANVVNGKSDFARPCDGRVFDPPDLGSKPSRRSFSSRRSFISLTSWSSLAGFCSIAACSQSRRQRSFFSPCIIEARIA
jgi:hypothetical protein